jgi:quinol monooxygenase YgiN
MHARSTLMAGNPDRLDDLVGFVRDEVEPMVQGFEGCVGLSMLMNRESGQCIVTSAWQDKASMDAAADGVRESRRRAGEILGAEPRVEEWEVAVMHRDGRTREGACCRVTWVQMQEGDIDRLADVYRDELLPQIESYDGFCCASLLVDRTTGRACSTVAFDSRAAMENSRAQSEKVREAGAARAGGMISDVQEFELARAHFHVPEMA